MPIYNPTAKEIIGQVVHIRKKGQVSRWFRVAVRKQSRQDPKVFHGTLPCTSIFIPESCFSFTFHTRDVRYIEVPDAYTEVHDHEV